MLYILKAERNSLAPSIHTLPNEIIAQIFRWVVYYGGPPSTSLLLVGGKIAIHSPELYSTLTFWMKWGTSASSQSSSTVSWPMPIALHSLGFTEKSSTCSNS